MCWTARILNTQSDICSVDLHVAWLTKNAYFFVVLSLTIVSSLLYLLASLVDPGLLPKADLTKDVLASFTSTNQVCTSCLLRYKVNINTSTLR